MIEKQFLANEKIGAGHMISIWRRRRLYAFCVTSFALFLTMMLAWTLNVRAFRVDNDLQFRLETSDQQVVSKFKQSLMQAMQQATTDDHLVKTIGELQGGTELDSSHLLHSDLDTIRSKLQVFTRINPDGDQAHVKVAFHGTGSVDETEFVKRLCEDILATLRPNHDFEPVDTALADIGNRLRKHVSSHDRFADSLKTMVDDVDQKLANLDQRLGDVWQDQPEPVIRSVAESKMRARQRQLERLKQEKDRLLLSQGKDSEELLMISQQMELIRFELKQLAKNQSSYGFQRNPTFQNASFRQGQSRQSSESEFFAEVSDQLGELQVSQLSASIDKIGQHRRQDLKGPIEMLDQISGNVESLSGVTPLASLLEPGVAYVKPIGGTPGAMHIVLLSIFAVGFGAVVVSQLNPADMDRGFENAKRLESTLGVPVVDSFPLESERENQQNKIPTRILRTCEVVVLMLVAVLVVSCVLSEDIRQTMMENPFDGFARIIWLMKNS